MSEHPPLDPAVVRWSAAPAERAGRPLLVVLHGYGSDEHDLFAFAARIPADFVVASVRAPLAPPFPTPGYSWYPIEGLDARDPAAVTAAAEGFILWLDEASDAPFVGLLGFSQGASVALQALRLAPERFAFAVNLSGYAAPGALPGDATLAALRPPVFWGRGTHDEVIPEPLITHTIDWLPGHSELSGRVYTGLGHSVSEEELTDVRAFLDQRLLSMTAGGPAPATGDAGGAPQHPLG